MRAVDTSQHVGLEIANPNLGQAGPRGRTAASASTGRAALPDEAAQPFVMEIT